VVAWKTKRTPLKCCTFHFTRNRLLFSFTPRAVLLSQML